MIQNIIVAVIVLASLVYVGYSIYRSVKPGSAPKSSCGGCTGCDLKNLNKGCATPVQNTGAGKNNEAFKKKISAKS